MQLPFIIIDLWFTEISYCVDFRTSWNVYYDFDNFTKIKFISKITSVINNQWPPTLTLTPWPLIGNHYTTPWRALLIISTVRLGFVVQPNAKISGKGGAFYLIFLTNLAYNGRSHRIVSYYIVDDFSLHHPERRRGRHRWLRLVHDHVDLQGT